MASSSSRLSTPNPGGEPGALGPPSPCQQQQPHSSSSLAVVNGGSSSHSPSPSPHSSTLNVSGGGNGGLASHSNPNIGLAPPPTASSASRKGSSVSFNHNPPRHPSREALAELRANSAGSGSDSHSGSPVAAPGGDARKSKKFLNQWKQESVEKKRRPFQTELKLFFSIV